MTYYPDWAPPAIVSTSRCTAGWANSLQNNLKAMLQDIHDAKGSASTFQSFMRAAHTSTGNFAASAITHSKLGLVTPDQHHDTYHRDSHTDGTDDIAVANSVTKGLVSATGAAKLGGIGASSTRNFNIASYYMGTTAHTVARTVSLGYRPQYVMIIRDLGGYYNHDIWEVMDGATYGFHSIAREYTEAGLDHKREKTTTAATNCVKIATDGFTVRGSTNYSASYKYTYVAFRSQ